MGREGSTRLTAVLALTVVAAVLWALFGGREAETLAEPGGAASEATSAPERSLVDPTPLRETQAAPDVTSLPVPEFAPGRATAEAPPADWATLSGRVVAVGGETVPDVDLWLLGEEDVGARITSPPRTTTDAAGRFHLGVPSEAQASAWGPTVIAGWSATHGLLLREVGVIGHGPTDLGDLVVDAGGVLTGRLVTAFGEPVTGHRVGIERARLEGPAEGMVGSAALFEGLQTQLEVSSDASGVFAFHGLPDCRLDLDIVRLIDTLQTTRRLHVAYGETTDIGDLVIAPAGSLSGQVLTPEGEPAPRAGVSVYLRRPTLGRRGAASGHDLSRSLWLEDDARFRFDDLIEGEYLVVGRARGFVYTPVGGVLTGSHDVVVRLRRGGRAQLLVLDAITGAPVPEVSIEARIPDAPRDYGVAPEGIIQVEAGDAPGTWTLACIGDEGATVIVRSEGHTTHQLRLPSPGEGGELAHTIVLRPQVRLEGLVLDDRRQPIEGAIVQAAPSGDAAVLGTLRADTDASGAFAIPDAPEASLRVWISASDHVSTTTTMVEDVQAGQALRLLVGLARSARLGGQVVDARGQALTDVPVQLLPVEPLPPPDVRDPGSSVDLVLTSRTDLSTDETVADADGRFTFDEITPGRYLLVATQLTRNEAHRLALAAAAEPDRPSWLTAVDLLPGDEQDVVLTWLEPRHVTGRVRAEGVARATGRVVLVPAGDGSRAASVADLDELAQFRFEDVPPGEYWVVAAVDGFADVHGERIEVTPRESVDVDMPVPDGYTIRGHVRDPAGRGVSGVPVTVHVRSAGTDMPNTDRQAALSALRPVAPTLSGDDGAFELRGLGEGTVDMYALGGPWLNAGGATVECAGPFDPDPVELRVRRGASVSGRVLDGAPGMLPTRLSAGLYSVDRGGHLGSQDLVDGTFLFEGLIAETVVVRLRDMATGGGYVGESRPLHLRAGEHVEVTVIHEPPD